MASSQKSKMDVDGRVLVTGAGGFIGGQLVQHLHDQGFRDIRAVDIKPLDEWYQIQPGAQNIQSDLSLRDAAFKATRDVRYVFNLAADMGGMGFIEANRALCMLSVLTSTHVLAGAKESKVDRFFYASSACVYAAHRQTDPRVTALREEDAYPAEPEDGYGWEKLFSERMARHFREDYSLNTRVARYHNVYGPNGTFAGGREKAPAAICRKVVEAKLSGRHEIEIWGDGEQTRSFMYITDCTAGTQAILESDIIEPINLGSSELVSINQLVSLVERIGGVRLKRRHVLNAPQGVRGRNSDNTRLKAALDWEPSVSLAAGLELTYAWIYDQLAGQRPATQRSRFQLRPALNRQAAARK